MPSGEKNLNNHKEIMMRKIFICFTLCILLCSCTFLIGNNKKIKFDPYPIPKDLDKAMNKTHMHISTSGDRYFRSLFRNYKKKAKMWSNEEYKDSFFLVDSAYFSKTLYQTEYYTLQIYKSGSKYRNKIGDEMAAPVNYLMLVTVDDKEQVIDSMTCYHFVYFLYESAERYFQIKNNTTINIYDFYIDEIKAQFKGKYTYKISKEGKFVLTNIYPPHDL